METPSANAQLMLWGTDRCLALTPEMVIFILIFPRAAQVLSAATNHFHPKKETGA